MAVGEKLFNDSGNLIYPISDASVIETTAGGKNNVQECLIDLYNKIVDNSLEGSNVNKLTIDIGYALLSTKDKSIASAHTSWGGFDVPTSNTPYLWKRTIFNYDGTPIGDPKYEISLMYPENDTETVYKAYVDPDKELPEIQYELNDEGLPNYNKPLLADNGWSYDPISISAEKPYVYMATRDRKDGKWLPFSAPALLSKWNFDSVITIKYAVTADSTPPNLNSGDTNPGTDWVDTNSGEFTGYLWMITATSVNKVLYKQDGIIWNGPNLLSIVK